ncbi:MAG TPA: hypothetical protein VFH31_19520, partial [Pyrinomonadaceae bacterium]|nr:hypothetical protein [Pyrinomonadaceae bacterium]
RARRLATIEAERGLRSTFFFMLDSPFYNLFEPHTLGVAKDIADAGHWVGLHSSTNGSEHFSPETIEQKAKWERNVLSDLLGTEIGAISFHDPTPETLLALNGEKIAGMVNVYGSAIRTLYHYCSDSNGYWRYQRLSDLLRTEQPARLHVLTHPEWWTPDPMSPRERIVRCVEGRAMATLRSYDLELECDGRENIS